jgi:hypothetical protein
MNENSEIFPLTALNFQYVVKENVSVYESVTDVTIVAL